MIKVGICEDDKICRDTVGKLLEWYFAKRETKYLQKEYKSGKEFMEEKENIDILILDIEMEGISGIQLKDWLWREEKDVKILFVTRHEEGMPEAFGKNVYGFLPKPLEITGFVKYMNRMMEDIDEDQSFMIKSLNKDIPMKMKSIFYFLSDNKYSWVISNDKKYFCDAGLHQLEQDLKKNWFFRCHKCYLVNFRNISRIEDEIYMKNGDTIPISRRKGKALRDSYQEYIFRKAR